MKYIKCSRKEGGHAYIASQVVAVVAMIAAVYGLLLQYTFGASSSNLIPNPSLETQGVNGDPTNWFRGGWGTNTAVLTYPTVGIDGARAAKVAITSYTDGDAKWYFGDVPVTSGTTYAFSHQYKSNVATEILARYTLTGGGVQYQFLGVLPVATTWTATSYTMTIPANVVSLTIFHVIHSVGSLEVDNFNLVNTSTGTPDTTLPTVSVTTPTAGTTVSGTVAISTTANDNVGVAGVSLLIDGVVSGTEDTVAPYDFSWNSGSVPNGAHTISARVRDAAGNLGNATGIGVSVVNIATPPPSQNLILNPSLETVGTGGNPQSWFRGGWGTNTTVFTYPVAGVDGVSAARIKITSYTAGDAKWYFKDVVVTPGSVYTLSHAYKADVPTQLVARYQTSAGTQYKKLATLASSNTWTTSTINITVPTNATAMSVFHLLFPVGTLDIDAYSLSKYVNSPAPVSLPTPKNKYAILNAITWGTNPLQNIPFQDISEASKFVLSVVGAGNLHESTPTLETKFVADVKAKGKKATFSVAGGSQDISQITLALTTNKNVLINNIATHLVQFGYDGVVLDVENTSLPANVLPDFINQLRARIGSAYSIGVYVQPWQIDTVHSRLQDAASALSWVAPMIYDFAYTLDQLKTMILAWLPKVNGDKSKLLAGVAVNYTTGLDTSQYTDVLKWVTDQGLGGVGLWQNTLFAQPWIDAQRSVWPAVQ